jgi:hypothetical protein
MIVSFGWTSPALLAGVKTVTRRDWAPSHAAKFHKGMLVDAWNWSPRVVQRNPHKIAIIRLTEDPKLELTRDAPESDYDAEGFRYLTGLRQRIGDLEPNELWDEWTDFENLARLWVIRFEVVEIVEVDADQLVLPGVRA